MSASSLGVTSCTPRCVVSTPRQNTPRPGFHMSQVRARRSNTWKHISHASTAGPRFIAHKNIQHAAGAQACEAPGMDAGPRCSWSFTNVWGGSWRSRSSAGVRIFGGTCMPTFYSKRRNVPATLASRTGAACQDSEIHVFRSTQLSGLATLLASNLGTNAEETHSGQHVHGHGASFYCEAEAAAGLPSFLLKAVILQSPEPG